MPHAWQTVPFAQRCNYCGRVWPAETLMLKLTFRGVRAVSYRGPCCAGDWGEPAAALAKPLRLVPRPEPDDAETP
jgi:hypothetical protein